MKRTLVVWLIFVIPVHFIPIPLLAQERILLAKSIITEHLIETVSTPDEASAQPKDKKTNWLIYGLVGAVLLGTIAAVAGGSGSGGGDGDTPGTGSIPVQW